MIKISMTEIESPSLIPLPSRLCRNPSLSLRATEGSVAILLFSMGYEIASVVSLPRNDLNRNFSDISKK